MDYTKLPEEKYVYYECFYDRNGFIYIENDNHIDETFFATSKIIRVSKNMPFCFHGLILRYYYFYG